MKGALINALYGKLAKTSYMRGFCHPNHHSNYALEDFEIYNYLKEELELIKFDDI